MSDTPTTTESLPTPADWRALVARELGPDKSFEETLLTKTLEGLTIEPLYTADSAPALGADVAPRSGAFGIAQGAGHPVPAICNRRILEDLEGGATGSVIQLDQTEVPDLTAMDKLLDGVFLEAIPVLFSTQAEGLPLAATFAALCAERGLEPEQVAAHFGMDPIATLARDGVLPGDLEDAKKELCLLAAHSRMCFDHARSIAVDSSVWHRAGANAATELGLAAATFTEYLRWLQESGLPPAAAHSEFVWRMDVGRDVFGNISKLRAARVLHAKILGASGIEEATPLVIHATTSPRGLAASDPWTNMLRTTLGTFAAGAGGADWITSVPFDAPIAEALDGHEPSALGRRVARNATLVLARESQLDFVGDPAGGSYFVETMTQDLARGAWDVFTSIEAAGGMAAALAAGDVDARVEADLKALEGRIRSGAFPMVGVTEFRPAEGSRMPTTRPFEGVEASQQEALSRLKARGPIALGAVDDFPHAQKAAAAGATIAELGGALVRGAPMTRTPLIMKSEEAIATEVSL